MTILTNENIETVAIHNYNKFNKSGMSWADYPGRMQESYRREAKEEIEFAEEICSILGDEIEMLQILVEQQKKIIEDLDKKKIKNVQPMYNTQVEQVYDKLSRYPSGRAGMRALSAAMDIPMRNQKAKLTHWIEIRIKEYGWEAIKQGLDKLEDQCK